MPTMSRAAASSSLVRNSQDLLTHLQASKRMGSWEDAVEVFSQCRDCGITPNLAHITVLADTLIQADQFGVLQTLLESPQAGELEVRREVATHAMRRIVEGMGWEKGLQVLSSFSPELTTTETYNEIVAACSRAGSWKECIRIMASMGLNDLAVEPVPSATPMTTPTTATDTEVASLSNPSKIQASQSAHPEALHELVAMSRQTASIEVCRQLETRPSPDAVTWASLISVLQETGQQDLALHLLVRLPPRTRELILTSTVALIHVWSKQRSKRGGK